MLTDAQIPVAFKRGEIVVDKNDCDSNGKPTGAKLWVWENKYNPPTKTDGGAMFYLLKDGPGESAKDLRWVREKHLKNWFPAKEEEPLIEL